jgi:phenylalanyl-tRNA synthetase beta chain
MNLLVSYDWLRDYVKLKKTPREFAARLSLSGPSIERIHPQGQGLEKVVVGRILKVKPHPNADKLRVVETDLGKEKKDIVCGGSNLKEGQLVAVALPGAAVRWHGEGEPVEIKIAVLRGVESYGMICAANEIGLHDLFPHAEREIMDLTGTGAKPGTPLAEALKLDDTLFDVEVTTNRPDAFSIVGMAREAAAIFEAPFLWKPAALPVTPAKAGAQNPKKRTPPFSVRLEAKKLCPRYMGAVMRGAKVGPSPAWLKARLASAGVRSINNLVDITNYVMLELGQPMHVFDYARLADGAIVVREAAQGERIKALDGNVYGLKPGQLVIADAKRPVAVAGVMGGEETGVTEKTTDIVFESAVFDPVSIRRTARALNLHSDSSLRYEKGLSTEGAPYALARAVQLAHELTGAELDGPVVDVRAGTYRKLKSTFRPARANELIGVAIPPAKMRKILVALGFRVSGPAAKWRVEVPWWRDHDIEGERDLVEEVARVHGYVNLPSVVPDGTLPLAPTDPALAWEDRAKRLLKGWGYTELMTYSFISRRLAETYEEPNKLLKVSNPLNDELEYMRSALMPSVLQAVAENQEEVIEGQAFELTNVYLPRPGDLPVEEPRLVVAAWNRDASGSAVRKVKGILEALCREFGIRGTRIDREAGTGKTWHPGRTADVRIGGDRIAQVGEIHPHLAARFGIERRVAVADINFRALLKYSSAAKFYAPIPDYPRSKRDLAFTVERHVEHADVAAKLKNSEALVKSVELFDVFEDEKRLGKGRKSMAYHLEFGADDRTLTAEEVDRAMENLRGALKKDFGADFRS